MSDFDVSQELNTDPEKRPTKSGKNALPLEIDVDGGCERFQLSVNSISIINSVRCAPEKTNSNDADSPKAQRSPQSTVSDTRYALGLDFVITALLAVAGITKVRQERKKTEIPDQTASSKKSAYHLNAQSSLTSSSGYWPNHEQKRSTVLIGLNDSLNQIAQTFYQDSDLGWLIADINKHRLMERWEEKLRVVSIAALQIIELPLSEEIQHFYKTRVKEACAANLLTVVLQNTMEKEKLEEKLAPVMPRLIQD